MPRQTLALAALLAALSAHAHADDTFYATVLAAPNPGDDRPGIRIDDGEYPRWIGLKEAKISWHFDPAVKIPPCELRPGTRVRIVGGYWAAERVEIVSLGAFAMTFVLEEWVIESSGNRPELAMTPGEIATMEALGSRSFLVRDSVTKALRDRGVIVLRQLAWMRHHRDPEVRARAEGLLARLGWEP